MNMVKKLDKKSLRESVIDTSIAMPIAWVTSFGVLALMMNMGMANAFLISAIQTLVLTIVSVVRKYIVRSAFKNSENFSINRTLASR
tara:strand:+ start:796 stop:1056 length:261 start_codon:yes stop_codon:yes gene_type:complete